MKLVKLQQFHVQKKSTLHYNTLSDITIHYITVQKNRKHVLKANALNFRIGVGLCAHFFDNKMRQELRSWKKQVGRKRGP